MKLCAIETKELEDKVLTRFTENQNDELLEDLSDYVINSQKEIERLNNIINELEKYLDNLHWFRLGKKDENGNMEYFYASISNFYEDTKSILKGSDK